MFLSLRFKLNGRKFNHFFNILLINKNKKRNSNLGLNLGFYTPLMLKGYNNNLIFKLVYLDFLKFIYFLDKGLKYSKTIKIKLFVKYFFIK
jgi:ribosomal protein S16